MVEDDRVPAHALMIAWTIAIALAALPLIFTGRYVAPAETGDEPLAFALGVTMALLVFLLPVAVPLALYRLRDPAQPMADWIVTGVQAGLAGGALLSLLVLFTHVFGGAVDKVQLVVIGVFAVTAIEGALAGWLARPLARRFAGYR